MEEKKLVSIVDDDHSMGRMLTRVVEAAGFDVALFCSAEEFLESGRVDDSDCLILDIDLTGMSGIELQHRLNESGYDVPIIFISGQAEENVQERVLADGAIGFLSKPFDINALLAAIRSAGTLAVL